MGVLPFVRLRPPDSGVSQLAVDNVRLVDWDQLGCDYLQAGGPIRESSLSPRVREAAGVPVTVVHAAGDGAGRAAGRAARAHR